MAMKHSLLGLIARKPASGYSLRKRFFRPGRPVLSQIYRALNEMLDEGLVTTRRVENQKRPAKNVFLITELGQAELKRWLTDNAAIAPIKDEMLQKLWFGSIGKTEDAIALIQSFKYARQSELKYYASTAKKIERRDLRTFGNALDKLYWDLVLDYVRWRSKAEMAWAEEAIKRISNVTRLYLEEAEKAGDPLHSRV